MDMRIPPLEIQILPESNPPRSRISVRRLAALDASTAIVTSVFVAGGFPRGLRTAGIIIRIIIIIIIIVIIIIMINTYMYIYIYIYIYICLARESQHKTCVLSHPSRDRWFTALVLALLVRTPLDFQQNNKGFLTNKALTVIAKGQYNYII